MPEFKGLKFTLQVAAEDCTGCALCVDVCPAKNKTEAKLKAINMRPQAPLRAAERENWNFFLGLPEIDRRKIKTTQLRQQQLLQPLFEFSGACAGCGETPYIKMLIAVVRRPRGHRQRHRLLLDLRRQPADDALRAKTPRAAARRGAIRCSRTTRSSASASASRWTSRRDFAGELLKKTRRRKSARIWRTAILNANQADEAGIYDQRERVAALKTQIAEAGFAGSETAADRSPTSW